MLRPFAENGGMASAAIDLDHKPRRGKARLRTGIPAALTTMDGRQEISLVDLSESGAGLVVKDAWRINGGVLKWMDYEVYGTVVRRGDGDIGLRFEEPIDPDWVLDTRQWLPTLADSKADVRRFARDWVRGGAPQKEPARISEMAAPRYGLDGQSGGWRSGAPILLGGAVLGLIAGYWSVFL
jgi:hypothetical protein